MSDRARELLLEHDVELVRAANPGPLTLSGTNTWLIGRDPCWVIDPGPALEEHVAAVVDAATARGGLAGIALTHDHADHVEAVAALRERAGTVPVAAARGAVELPLAHGDRIGPLEALATPGHAPDHFAFVAGRVAFSGDAVLGEGSVFVAAEPGALRGYLEGLARLRARELDLICPGHGPPIVDPAVKLDEYVAHRRERERRLLEALDAGKRTEDELLDAAWSDVPAVLRGAASITLRAHLEKLREEGRLPADVPA